MLQSVGWQRVGHNLAPKKKTVQNCTSIERNWQCLSKQQEHLPFDPEILLLNIYPATLHEKKCNAAKVILFFSTYFY